MTVSSQHRSEEWAARRENHFVSLDLVFITHKSYIKKLFILSKLSECHVNIRLKVIPSQAELFKVAHFDSKTEVDINKIVNSVSYIHGYYCCFVKHFRNYVLLISFTKLFLFVAELNSSRASCTLILAETNSEFLLDRQNYCEPIELQKILLKAAIFKKTHSCKNKEENFQV